MKKKSYKVCVYAICKNEMKFLDSWLNSMSEADYVVVLDTGSTDGSFEFLSNDPRCTYVERKIIEPFRFDTARNESLKLVPNDSDILVCTDPDETFNKGWCNNLKRRWDSNYTRATYNYAWSHDNLGNRLNVFRYDKIHIKGYEWKYPVHEVLYPYIQVNSESDREKVLILEDKDVFLDHWQDLSVNRKSYLDLLLVSYEENPSDAHVMHLLAREYYLQGDYNTARKYFLRLLLMEDAYSPTQRECLLDTHLMLASISSVVSETEESLYWCNRFIQLDGTYREPYLLMIENMIRIGAFQDANNVLKSMYEKCFRHYSWVEKNASWLYTDKFLSVDIYYGLSLYGDCLKLIDECLQIDPMNSILLTKKINCIEMLNPDLNKG